MVALTFMTYTSIVELLIGRRQYISVGRKEKAYCLVITTLHYSITSSEKDLCCCNKISLFE